MSGSGGSFSGSTDEYMLAWHEAVCAARERCCASIGEPIDYDDCVTLRLEPREGTLGQRVANGTIVLDPDKADDCLEGLARTGCDDPPPDACWDVFVGTLAPGQPCDIDLECVAPAGAIAECEQRAIDSRLCVQYTGAELGDPCEETCVEAPGGYISCTSRGGTGPGICWTRFGYYCGDSGTCVPLRQYGESCEGNEQCADGARCVDGLCADPVPLGEACTLVDVWQSPCVDSAYCAEDGICRPLRRTGEMCDDVRACASGWCGSNGRCAPRYHVCGQ